MGLPPCILFILSMIYEILEFCSGNKPNQKIQKKSNQWYVSLSLSLSLSLSQKYQLSKISISPNTPSYPSSSQKLTHHQQQSRRYDSRTTTFSPEGRLFQVEYAMEAINNAASALGLLCSDGIVLAVEKRVQSKLLEKSKTSEKMYNHTQS